MTFGKWCIACAGLCMALTVTATAQEWSEPELLERFQSQSLQVREWKARVALAEAEVRTRAVYPNPFANYSREGAGNAAFYELGQTLPISRRLRYVREAGRAAVEVTEADRDFALWSLRNDLRIAFYRLLASQERVRLLTADSAEIEQLIRLLRRREEEGEGSRYDRVRAEREFTEFRTDRMAAQSLTAAAGAGVARFLPEGTNVLRVRGALLSVESVPALDGLVRRAFAARADYRAEQRNLARFQLEEQAARRLRFPEPVVTAGVKRGNVVSGLFPNPLSDVTKTAIAIGVTVPLPVFNRGQYEITRYEAEQQRIEARRGLLERQIRTEVEGAREVLRLRKEAMDAYEKELESAGGELIQIAQVAYQEGEIGILELLDAWRIRRNAMVRRLDLQAGVTEALLELHRMVGEEVGP